MSWYDTIDRIDAQAFQDAQSMKGFYIGNGQSSIGMLKDSLLRQLKWPNEDDQYAAFGRGQILVKSNSNTFAIDYKASKYETLLVTTDRELLRKMRNGEEISAADLAA